MLIQFNFKNFRSFRDEVSLDMTATKITEHPTHVVESGGTSCFRLRRFTVRMPAVSQMYMARFLL